LDCFLVLRPSGRTRRAALHQVVASEQFPHPVDEDPELVAQAVFAGMIGVTMFGLVLTPVFYVLLRRLTGNRPLKLHGEAPHGKLFAGAPKRAPSVARAPAAVLEPSE
jgi:multidrug efflux pump